MHSIPSARVCPDDHDNDDLHDRLAANLAEGNGRFTRPDRRNFFTIARGSAQECVPLIEIARRRGLIDNGVARVQRDRLEVIAKMISGLINGLDDRSRRNEARTAQ